MDLQSFNVNTQSGSFELSANLSTPLDVLKNNSVSSVQIAIMSTGQWCLVSSETSDPKLAKYKQLVDGDGYERDKDDERFQFKYPHLKPATLVSEIKDAEGNVKSSVGGKQQSLELQPGETLSFIINDAPSYFNDNAGKLTVNYSVSI